MSKIQDLSVRLERVSDDVATVWFDAPGRPVNTFSAVVFDDLADALDQVDRLETPPKQLRIASAKEGTFIAGADLKAIRDLSDAELDTLLKRGQSLFSRIAALPMQTVALIHGAALGGGLEIALACDFRIAAAAPNGRRVIGLPEITLGIIPGWGGTVRLPLLIGVADAADMLLSGAMLDADEAKALGLIDEVALPSELAATAERYRSAPPKRAAIDLSDWGDELGHAMQSVGLVFESRRLAAKTMTNVLMQSLSAAQANRDLSSDNSVSDINAMQIGFDLERKGLIDCRNSESGKALIAAFFDKRKK